MSSFALQRAIDIDRPREYLLVVVARHSRFPEVEIVQSTRLTSTVIPKLDNIFGVHGVLPFSKAAMALTLSNCPWNKGNLNFSTPKWPQGNVEVERFMQPLGKSLTASKLYGRAWKDDRQGMSGVDNQIKKASDIIMTSCHSLPIRTIRSELMDLKQVSVQFPGISVIP
jgi:hypothetical protein